MAEYEKFKIWIVKVPRFDAEKEIINGWNRTRINPPEETITYYDENNVYIIVSLKENISGRFIELKSNRLYYEWREFVYEWRLIG